MKRIVSHLILAACLWSVPALAQEARVTINLATKTVSKTNAIAVKETVPVRLINIGTSDGGNLLVRLYNNTNGIMAQSAAFTNVPGTNQAMGMLDLNTVQLVAAFSNRAPTAPLSYQLVVWDSAQNRLLVNDIVQVGNNPYADGQTPSDALTNVQYVTQSSPAGGILYGPFSNVVFSAAGTSAVQAIASAFSGSGATQWVFTAVSSSSNYLSTSTKTGAILYVSGCLTNGAGGVTNGAWWPDTARIGLLATNAAPKTLGVFTTTQANVWGFRGATNLDGTTLGANFILDAGVSTYGDTASDLIIQAQSNSAGSASGDIRIIFPNSSGGYGSLYIEGAANLEASQVDANFFRYTGNGVNITNLQDGTHLTNVNASALASGTVPFARLPPGLTTNTATAGSGNVVTNIVATNGTLTAQLGTVTGGGSGGAQGPWTNTVDAAGRTLTNFWSLVSSNSSGTYVFLGPNPLGTRSSGYKFDVINDMAVWLDSNADTATNLPNALNAFQFVGPATGSCDSLEFEVAGDLRLALEAGYTGATKSAYITFETKTNDPFIIGWSGPSNQFFMGRNPGSASGAGTNRLETAEHQIKIQPSGAVTVTNSVTTPYLNVGTNATFSNTVVFAGTPVFHMRRFTNTTTAYSFATNALKQYALATNEEYFIGTLFTNGNHRMLYVDQTTNFYTEQGSVTLP